MTVHVGILTLSDRAARHEYEDRSGPLIRTLLQERLGWAVTVQDVLPDERDRIEQRLIEWSDDLGLDLILTTGGTGFAPRDCIPEATLAVIDRQAPGLAEGMRAASLRVTPHAMLSRAVAGMRGRTLIINLPGSPKAVRENLDAVLPVLPHALALLQGDPAAEAGHSPNPLI